MWFSASPHHHLCAQLRDDLVILLQLIPKGRLDRVALRARRSIGSVHFVSMLVSRRVRAVQLPRTNTGGAGYGFKCLEMIFPLIIRACRDDGTILENSERVVQYHRAEDQTRRHLVRAVQLIQKEAKAVFPSAESLLDEEAR